MRKATAIITALILITLTSCNLDIIGFNSKAIGNTYVHVNTSNATSDILIIETTSLHFLENGVLEFSRTYNEDFLEYAKQWNEENPDSHYHYGAENYTKMGTYEASFRKIMLQVPGEQEFMRTHYYNWIGQDLELITKSIFTTDSMLFRKAN